MIRKYDVRKIKDVGYGLHPILHGRIVVILKILELSDVIMYQSCSCSNYIEELEPVTDVERYIALADYFQLENWM